ncbi:MAG: hypothetical protein M3268_03235, partial [Acidobacteriota bacterium]|nr:hypothetical protein [Acidobacteriota bacterium]
MTRNPYALALALLLTALACASVAAQSNARAAANQQASADYPAPVEGDYVIRDFHFRSGETLPELKLHYTT